MMRTKDRATGEMSSPKQGPLDQAVRALRAGKGGGVVRTQGHVLLIVG
jgi:lauroyl/myristoyl acyltransferase